MTNTNAIYKIPYNMPWESELSKDIYDRLAHCVSKREDIPIMAKAYYNAAKKYDANFDGEEALIYILELLDCNGQFVDPTQDEYDDWLFEINH